MLKPEQLKDVLHTKSLSRRDQVLIVLSCDGTSKPVGGVKKLAVSAGLRRAKDWNISAGLSRADGLAIWTDDGWELTAKGRLHVAGLVGAAEDRIENVATSLRTYLDQVTSQNVRTFLDEAVSCFERGYQRAAIVLSWAGAVSVLYEHVVAHRLAEFNAEATRRTANTKSHWKGAKTTDDLGAMKERELLDVLVAVNVMRSPDRSAAAGAVGPDRRHAQQACGYSGGPPPTRAPSRRPRAIVQVVRHSLPG